MIPEMKNLRVLAPEKYLGEDDIEMFDSWLSGLLRWYQVHNLTGQAKYFSRVDLCGTTLKGLATKWYVDEVKAWNRPTQEWYFEDLICAMYKRFIHEVTAQNAAIKFEHTQYSKSKGALAYYNDLKRYAGCMVIPTDDYMMKTKFIKGLLTNMVECLLKNRQVFAEHTPFEGLLSKMKVLENSTQLFNILK
jgi:hypothetical protein